MIFDKQGNTTIVFQEDTSIPNFRHNLRGAYKRIKNDHIVVNLFSFSELIADDLLEFLELSNIHRASKKSFVLVTSRISYEDVPDELCVVPTLQEAHDFIEMEEIERDLDL